MNWPMITPESFAWLGVAFTALLVVFMVFSIAYCVVDKIGEWMHLHERKLLMECEINVLKHDVAILVKRVTELEKKEVDDD